jgi:hypothetical protein
MDRNGEGCLIDFHSGNNFEPQYGLGSPMNQYMELFPCINSLWFGEGYDYNSSPDYWLVEVSGIPFGLFSEMLQGGGNPWRGMVYGMTNRLAYQRGNPSALWKLWDTFGIADAEMIGYWCKDSPVRTGEEKILATVYRRPDRTLVSLASWAETETMVNPSIDWKALGLNAATARIHAPAIEGLQEERVFGQDESIPVQPGKGWLLIIERGE